MVLPIKVNFSKLQTWLHSGNFHVFSFAKIIFMVWELPTLVLHITLTTMLEVIKFLDLSVMLKTF